MAAAPTPATVAAVTAWLAAHDLPLADLQAGRQRLEDVFLQLTSRGRPVRALLAQVRLELELTFRNGESLLLTLGIPVAVLVFFSLVDVLPIEGDAVDFLAPGILALAMFARPSPTWPSPPASSAATACSSGWGPRRSGGRGCWPRRRSRCSPCTPSRSSCSPPLAVALGWRPSVEPLPLVGAVLLAVVAFTGLALVVAGRLRALVALAAANALFVAGLLLSGMVFPLDELPAGLRTVVRALPSTALAEAVQGALTAGEPVPGTCLARPGRLGRGRHGARGQAVPLGAVGLTAGRAQARSTNAATSGTTSGSRSSRAKWPDSSTCTSASGTSRR